MTDKVKSDVRTPRRLSRWVGTHLFAAVAAVASAGLAGAVVLLLLATAQLALIWLLIPGIGLVAALLVRLVDDNQSFAREMHRIEGRQRQIEGIQRQMRQQAQQDLASRLRDVQSRLARIESGLRKDMGELRDVVNASTDPDVFAQVEAFMQLVSLLKPRYPLPPSRGWAASPDFLLLVLDELWSQDRDGLVVECGSGLSSIVLGYAVTHLSGCRVVSLEHDSEYATFTRGLLASHGLERDVEVRHAPLVAQPTPRGERLWYHPSGWADLDGIEMLVIDGPPRDSAELARYPALPLLQSALTRNATVLLDDGYRAEERRGLELWATDHREWRQEIVETEKGAVAVRAMRT